MPYTELVAYVNGLIAIDGVILRDGLYKIHIAVDREEQSVVDALLQVYGVEAKLREVTRKGNTINVNLDVEHLIACDEVEEQFGGYAKVLLVPPANIAADLKRHYLRGVFDMNGSIKYKHGPSCRIGSILRDTRWKSFVETVRDCVKAVFVEEDARLVWNDHNAIDFLSELYDGSECAREDRVTAYKALLRMDRWPQKHRAQFETGGTSSERLEFRFTRVVPGAPAPFKARASDAGYDLHLVRKISEKDGLSVYGTGIAVQPPFGYYFEIVGRSSISKTGYMLANSIGVIDSGYNQEIMVGLRKVWPDAPELLQKDKDGKEIPLRMIQLIPRKLTIMRPVEVDSLSASERGGSGGLGAAQFKGK